ncbi:MAG: RNA polymerase sigma factor [Bacteroidota bacterium]
MKNILKGCRNLNRKAQREMVNLLSQFLYPVCRRYANSHEDAKDLLQESLILIFNNIHQCKSNQINGFKGWSRKITINTALAKQRKRGFRMEVIHTLSVEHIDHPDVHSQLNVEDILTLLEQLPRNQRIVFNLAIIDGYSHREIADFLDIKESSSRTFLARARNTMQQLINREWQPKKNKIGS